jgi:hypothetical protein
MSSSTPKDRLEPFDAVFQEFKWQSQLHFA